MLYFGSDTAQYENAQYKQLGEGGDDYNFAQVLAALVITVPPGGIILRTLEFGANTDPAQAGGTIPIGIIDITAGTDGAPQVMSGTLALRSDDVGYVFSVLSGLSTALEAGKIYAINIGKPTVNVFVTANDDTITLYGEASSPATPSLTGNWAPTNAFIRNIPLRAGYDLVSSATVDTLDDPIQIGQPFSFTTSDLGAVTGVSISTDGNDTAMTEAIDIDAPAGDGDATVLDWIDGDYMPLIGAVSVAITDGTKTATKNTNIIIPTGYLSVNFENAETTDPTYLTTALYNFGHPVADGDLCSWIDANGVDVGENGSIECDDPMTFPFVIQKFSTGLIKMYQIDIDEKSSGGGGSGGIKLGIQQLIIRRL